MLSFGRDRLTLVRQTEAAECGIACLAMLASYYGHRTDLGTLRRRCPVSLSGVTLRGLITIAAHLKLIGRPVRFELEQIDQLRLPVIVHWDMKHFVVLKSHRRGKITIHDPARGVRTMSLGEASNHITGVALEITPAPDFKRVDERSRLPFSVFWSNLIGSGHALIQVLLLSLVLQVLILAAPFYMQITVDEVIARGDTDLLVVLAIGFGLLAALRVAATTIRSLILLIIQNVLSFQIGARLFHHLIRLPAAYFEKRHVGDILSRFGSLQPIRTLLAEGLIVALIDGGMAVFSLILILVYSPQLTAIVLGAVAIYAIIRVSFYRILWRRTEETIAAAAQENSTFIETVRAVHTLKLFNSEADREGVWLNRSA
jgi:ATP-binding cassette, subfamily B, bacterial CvaB/MchF/RaxB